VCVAIEGVTVHVLELQRKGTLARRLYQAELALESTKVQMGVHEQLLKDKQRQVDRVTIERDVLQLEKTQLETLLEEARRELSKVRVKRLSKPAAMVSELEDVTGAGLWTTSAVAASMPYQSQAWTSLSTLSSTRRKLPQVPSMTMVDVKPPTSSIVPTSARESLPGCQQQRQDFSQVYQHWKQVY